MPGQGCPNQHAASWLRDRLSRWCCAPVAARRLILLWALLSLVATDRAVAEQLRVRIAWGGGTARLWSGRIEVSDAQIVSHRCLGLSANSPGSLVVGPTEVRIAQRLPQSYDGIDLTLDGSLDGEVTIQLQESTGVVESKRLNVKLSEIVETFRNVPLDEEGNQLLLRRQPGDWLRLDIPNQPMIFPPGHEFSLTPAVARSSFGKGVTCRLRLQLLRARGGGEISSDERAFVPDENGSAEIENPFEIVLPETEGVYDLHFTASVKRIVGTPFRREVELRRRLQVVVLRDEALEASDSQWRVVDQFDPANPSWRQWVNRLPGISYLPGFDPAKPLGNGKMVTVQHRGTDWVKLGMQGWQVFPLPTAALHRPHIVEIDYPADLAQSLGASVLQANGAGSLTPPNVDAGVEVNPVVQEFAEGESSTRTMRILFWPRRRTPLLMLTNRRETAAVFGKIRVYAGPTRLPARFDGLEGGRVAAAYFDKPLFAENFGADEGLDPQRRTTLDDWQTFYHGAHRLTEYLQFAGYNSAIVNVAREGGSLFPSRTLEPTPKFDSGVFFVSGQDPFQKDVLELMFRLFDRERLRLIPSIHFSGTLPALERWRRQPDSTLSGLDLVGAEGHLLRKRDNLPAYNPLDPRVREAMRNVVAELVTRYGHHPSFAGVAIQLGPDTYAQLPNEFWGLDDETVKRFEADTGVALGGEGPTRYAQRAAKLQGEVAQKWIAWRANEMTELYRSFSNEVRRHRLDTRLVLATAEMFDGVASQRALAPRVLHSPPVAQTALRLGIDADLLRDSQQGIVLLHPERANPQASLSQQGMIDSLSRNEASRSFFAAASSTDDPHGVLFTRVPATLTMPEFDRVSPYGANSTLTKLQSLLSPGGPHARKRFATQLASSDHQWIVDGGDMLTMGQEEHTQQWLHRYTTLPPIPFNLVAPRSPTKTQPIVARQATIGPRTCAYLVNESPWKTSVTAELSMPPGCTAVDEAGQPMPGLVATPDGGGLARWNLEMQPYELVVVWFGAPNVQVVDWQATMPAAVVAAVQQQLTSVRDRAQQLQRPHPLQTLVNGDFEAVSNDLAQPIQGWTVTANGGSAQLDRQIRKNGTQSLRLSAPDNGQVRVVSTPIPVPATGKLYVFVWMRVADQKQQPRLRVMVRGDDGYFSYLHVGAKQQFQLSSDWGEGFLFPFAQIPSTVKNLTLEFTLMGGADVWIDGVSPFDYWFARSERNKLITDIGRLGFDLQRRGSVSDSLRFLDSYWSEFLIEHVPAAPVAAVANVPPAAKEEKPAATARNPVNRIRDLVPPLKFPRMKR